MLHFNYQLENHLHEDAFYKESYNSKGNFLEWLFQTIKVFNQRSDVNFIIKNKSSIKRQLPKNKY